MPILIKPDDIAELGKGDENFLLRIRQWKYGLNRIIGTKVFDEFGFDNEPFANKLGQFGLKIVNFITESVTKVNEIVDLAPSKRKIVESFLKSKR